MRPEAVYPAMNVHSFLFSNPFHDSPANKHYNFPSHPKTPDSRIFCEDPYARVSLSFSRLRSESLRLAQGIHKTFGTPIYHTDFGSSSVSGPVVLIQLPNSAVLPVIVLGFLAAGWAVSTANPANTAFELAHYVETCQPRVVITQPDVLGEKTVLEACRIAKSGDDVEVFVVDANSEWKDVSLMNGLELGLKDGQKPRSRFWTALLADKEYVVPPMTMEEANTRVAFILWTSGTTGKPKGAMLSHRAIITGTTFVRASSSKFTEHEKWIGLAPHTHIYALFNQILIGIPLGATIVIQRKFDLKHYLSNVARYKITLLHIIPPIAVAISGSDLVHQPEYSLSSIKGIVSAGAPVPPEHIRRIRDLTGVIIKSIYGMTELGPITYVKDHALEELQDSLGSAGVPIPPVEISIARMDGLDAAENVSGEIVIRSPAIMMGYIKNPEATKEMLRSDGAHTGDLGYLDEKGYLQITGRLKELIKYKAFQVSPTELEAIISEIPDIKDVAVGSVYSEAQATELPMAYVVPLTNDLLHIVSTNTRSQAEGRALSAQYKGASSLLPLESLADKIERLVEKKCIYYKRLRGGIMFVNELPKSPSGKVVRLVLKDLQGVFIDGYANSKRQRLESEQQLKEEQQQVHHRHQQRQRHNSHPSSWPNKAKLPPKVTPVCQMVVEINDVFVG